MNYRLHPEADREFAAAVQYYSEISPELGVRFYRGMERLLLAVCAHPERYWKFDPPPSEQRFSLRSNLRGKTGLHLDCRDNEHEAASWLLA